MTERIVVSYSVSDGCTYSCSVVVPLLAESRAAFIDELETHACEYLLATPPKNGGERRPLNSTAWTSPTLWRVVSFTCPPSSQLTNGSRVQPAANDVYTVAAIRYNSTWSQTTKS